GELGNHAAHREDAPLQLAGHLGLPDGLRVGVHKGGHADDDEGHGGGEVQVGREAEDDGGDAHEKDGQDHAVDALLLEAAPDADEDAPGQPAERAYGFEYGEGLGELHVPGLPVGGQAELDQQGLDGAGDGADEVDG